MKYSIIELTIHDPFGNANNDVHPILLWDEEAIILVDCGFSGSLSEIEKELSRHGLCGSQLDGIVLTHHDHDHMGAAAAFKRAYPNVVIYSSAKEAPFISAQEKPLRLCQAEEFQSTLPEDQQAFGKAFCEMLRNVEPVQVDKLLYDGDYFNWCGGCKIIETPGHTPGHISILLEKEKAIITGDAIALENNSPVIANPQFAIDLERAAKSMKDLLAMGMKTLYCYHGGTYYI